MLVKVISAFLPLHEYLDATVSQGCGVEAAGSWSLCCLDSNGAPITY